MIRAAVRLSEEASLQDALTAMAPKGVRIGCRSLREGDEAHLLGGEAHSIPTRHAARRAASGSARWIARALLGEIGMPDFAILRAPSGAPIWPEGITGSLAHDDEMAVAAIARSHIGSIGLDVEPSTPLPQDVYALIATEADRTDAAAPPLAGRILFAAKEAVYKAVYPLDREILGYEDIAVDLGTGRAWTRSGREATLLYCVAPRIAVLAIIAGGRGS